MNQTTKLFQRLNSDTIFDFCENCSISYDTKLEIIQMIHKRMINGISQKRMSEMCGVGLATIKRFELLQVDSLVLFNKYRYFLGGFDSKIRKGWV